MHDRRVRDCKRVDGGRRVGGDVECPKQKRDIDEQRPVGDMLAGAYTDRRIRINLMIEVDERLTGVRSPS